MISEYNTSGPGPSAKGKGMSQLFTLLIVGAICYFGYKYFIKPTIPKENPNA